MRELFFNWHYLKKIKISDTLQIMSCSRIQKAFEPLTLSQLALFEYHLEFMKLKATETLYNTEYFRIKI